MKSNFVKTLIVACLAITLGACGVKPKRVDPPESVQNDTFPNQYPSSK